LESRIALDLHADVLALASGGAAVCLQFAPELGSRHLFTLEIGAPPIDVYGVVRNCRVLPDRGYEVGVEFDGLNPADVLRLEEFVRKKLEALG
jgi:hypothetical protein